MHLLLWRRNVFDLFFSLFFFYLKCNSITAVGHDVSVKKGGNITLFCHLIETEENLIHIIWQKQTRETPKPETFLIVDKDGKTENKNDLLDKFKFTGNIKEKNGSVQLLGMTLQDDGIYTCISIFPNGKTQTDINVTVRVPPVGNVTGKTHVWGHSDIILASCVASHGRPAAEVFWRLGALNDSLRTETSSTEHTDGSVTSVSHTLGAPSKDLNQKKIQCVIKHSTLTKELELDYIINVHYPPDLVVISPDDPTQTQEYLCSVDCNPAPTSYIWIKLNGSTLRSEGNKLFIPKSSTDSNGVYICTASNQYGSASGFLYVNNTGSTDDCWLLFGLVFSCAVLWISLAYILSSGRKMHRV
ncbi:nectin-3 [Carassius auratus]|uniref:Nectin-3-like n=1 Tax=Carassius auratus TaxID=7957 RepID=A0A6P6Q3U3_CARAU|nr:nectin-3-like [Carassius auratus]XP_026128149.1 nectin-3-like [Carassius auratus]XP_026128150.1 nectin-3-like [Carassius auratus]